MIMDEKKYNSDDLEQGYMLFLQDLAFFMGESFKEGEVIPHRLKESAQTIENLLHSDSDDIEELLASELKNIFIKKQRNYSEPYCPKIMSGVPSKAAFNALTAFMPFFFAVPM